MPYLNGTVGQDRPAQLNQVFVWVYLIMAAGLGTTAITGYLIQGSELLLYTLVTLTEVRNDNGELERQFSASGWWWTAAATQLLMVIFIARTGYSKSVNATLAVSMFIVFALLNGVTLAPVLHQYTAASVAMVFVISSAMFAGSAAYGYLTNRNLLSLHGLVMQGLIGALVLLIAGLFIENTLFDVLLSMGIIVLFLFINAFDMQWIEQRYAEEGWSFGLAVNGALSLYLNFLNIFIHSLRLFGINVPGNGD